MYILKQEVTHLKQRRHLRRVSAVTVIVVHALVRDAASRCVASGGYGAVGNTLGEVGTHEKLARKYFSLLNESSIGLSSGE